MCFFLSGLLHWWTVIIYIWTPGYKKSFIQVDMNIRILKFAIKGFKIKEKEKKLYLKNVHLWIPNISFSTHNTRKSGDIIYKHAQK